MSVRRQMTLGCVLVGALVILTPVVPAAAQQAAPKLRDPDVIYVPTPQEIVDAMLALAKVTAKDVVYDLGSGDGRIPITAAEKYGARAIDIDINPQRIKEANENLAKPSVGDKVTFLNQDLFEADIRDAHPDRVTQFRHGSRVAAGANAGRERPQHLLLDDQVSSPTSR